MSDQQSLVSKTFQTFLSEAPQHAQAWGAMVQGLASASALDKKTAVTTRVFVASPSLCSGLRLTPQNDNRERA